LSHIGFCRHPAFPASERTGLLISVLVGVTMVTGIISSLGAPLIPSVARTLHISLDSAQWSLTVALLSASVAAPIMGRLGDGPRRRETILVGLAIVLAGSVIAGLASSLIVLIVGRAMQGVGLGLAPVTMAAARDHLPAERAPGVIGLLSVSGAAAVGAGYPLSGLIATDQGVHAAFFFGALMSGIALAAALMVIPSNRHSSARRLDMTGALVGAAGLIALLLAIGQGQQWGWDSASIVTLFVAAAVILAAWVRLQLDREAPLVDLRQLRVRAVLTADLAAIVLGVAMYMFLTLVTEFVQEPRTLGYGLGASTLVAGLCLVPFSVMGLVASRSVAPITKRLSASVVLVGGSLIIAAAGGFFALLHGTVWEAFVAMGVIGIGFGYTFAAIPGLIVRAVPSGETGSAMGLYQVIRYVGFSIGSALAASILAGNIARGSTQVTERGYVAALWVGTAICALSACASWLLSRTQAPISLQALAEPERDRLAVEDAELATAGLVGVEADLQTPRSHLRDKPAANAANQCGGTHVTRPVAESDADSDTRASRK
jgi:predicted MFS family arabinose efflux permease